MRERVTVVTLSVCQSVSQSVCHFLILEKAPFSGLKLTSVHSRRRFKLALFENRSYFGEKVRGTSAVTSVIYSGNAQSLNGLHVIF